MKRVKSILWGILGITNAIGFACLGAIAGIYFVGEAIEDFRNV